MTEPSPQSGLIDSNMKLEKASRSAVYLAECRDPHGVCYAKIGKANNPISRLPSLQNGCPFEFDRVRWVFVSSPAAALAAEKRVHQALKSLRIRGEWFRAETDAQKMALECFSEVIAAFVKGPVKVHALDTAQYDRVRKFYQSHFGHGRKAAIYQSAGHEQNAPGTVKAGRFTGSDQ